MSRATIAPFRPKLSKQEAKADAITRNVRALLDAEAAAREAKTERLRAARLARDAQTGPAPVKILRTATQRGR